MARVMNVVAMLGRKIQQRHNEVCKSGSPGNRANGNCPPTRTPQKRKRHQRTRPSDIADDSHNGIAIKEATMPRFRKKPVEIEAMQVPPPVDDDNISEHGELAAWLQMNCSQMWEVANHHGEINIATLEGTMLANNGDWIIKGVKGEMYPCKPDIFETTYDPVA